MNYTGPLVGFDTETTGVHVHDDNTRVVTCAVIMEPSEGAEMTTLEWTLNPEIEIPTDASDVHGITTEMAVRDGMNYKEGLSEIAHTFKYIIENKIPTIAYNGGFDATLLRIEFLRVGVDFPDVLWDNLIMLDPLVMDKHTDKYRKGKRTLSVVSALHGYSLENAHDATADVLGTIHVGRILLPKFVRKIENEFHAKVETFEDLMVIQANCYREQMDGLEEYFQRTEPEKTINKSWPFQDKEN